MPTAHYQRVRSFMERVGQDTPRSPTIPDAATRLLRAKLILEETMETLHALGVTVELADGCKHVIEHRELVLRATDQVDLEGVVDGCADISVVTIGTLIAFGVDDEEALAEVDQSNLRKFGPGSYRREDGKWIKPPDWTPPDLQSILVRQGRGIAGGT